MTLFYKASAAGHMLGISTAVLRTNIEEMGIELEMRAAGATQIRVFKPDDIYAIARWRRMHIKNLHRPARKVIAAVWSPKGGVGKSTATANIACAFAEQGLSVLMVDLDFQGNLTSSVGYDCDLTVEEADADGVPRERLVEYTLANLLAEAKSDDRQPLSLVIKKPYGEHGPHLIPADIALDQLDYQLLASTLAGNQSDLLIGKWIHAARTGHLADCDLSQYDVILFDCPPAKNRLVRSALLAADFVISPVSLDAFSSKAMSNLTHVLSTMQQNYQRWPQPIILPNEYDAHRVRSATHLNKIYLNYGQYVLEQNIRASEDIRKALDNNPMVPVVLWKPTSPVADDLRNAAKLLANQRLKMFTPVGSEEIAHA
jgi:chromosome partitioning protein